MSASSSHSDLMEREIAHIRAELRRLGISETDAQARVVFVFQTGPTVMSAMGLPEVVLREEWERRVAEQRKQCVETNAEEEQ